MKGAVHHCIAADPGDRHQSREHHERRAAPDSGVGQRTIYAPLDLHHVSVPAAHRARLMRSRPTGECRGVAALTAVRTVRPTGPTGSESMILCVVPGRTMRVAV